MASPKKAKPRARRPRLLHRAMLHSCLCFLVGLAAGLAPTSRWTSAASTAATTHVFRALHAVDGAINQTVLLIQQQQRRQPGPGDVARSPPPLEPLRQPQLLLVVTATERSDPERRAAGLTRAAHALRLVPPPVLWLVVEPAREARATARLLRGAGVAYRHLSYPENFTAGEAEVERHHQRNVALGHVEEHRLAGVVLFAGLGDVYDLRFFTQLRQIRTFGAWPAATVSERERKATVEGPVCGGAPWLVTGWFSTAASTAAPAVVRARPPPGAVDVSRGFAFGSALLWDPRRWDTFPVSEPDASQDSVKFVQRLAVEEYNKSRGMPNHDCSEIMVWHGDQLAAT
ncbi:unnamed protein product [Alopecurus aequalis]